MGQFFSFIGQMYDQTLPPKPKFSIDDIPDQSGKVIIVTGGYTGIGKETAYAMLRKNAKVYIAGRSQSKAEMAIKELKERTGKDALFLELDLANLRTIRKSATEFQSRETQLHILFNNGGVMEPPVDQLTEDGYDLTFGTNCLGHWYFTQLLVPTLLETAKTAPDRNVRVITTSSTASILWPKKSFDWDSLQKGSGNMPARKRLGTTHLYFQSKYGNVVAALELARRYGDQGIISMSCNPGNLKSELQRHVSYAKAKIIGLALYPTPMGALTQLWGGTMPDAASHNGGYLIPWARVGPMNKNARDPEVGQQLWKWFEEQIKDIDV